MQQKRKRKEKVEQGLSEFNEKMKSTNETLDRVDRILAEVAKMQAEYAKSLKETKKLMKELSKETDRKMQETALQIKELSKETDRKMQETDRQMKETDIRIDKRLDRLDKSIDKTNGNFNNKWGKFVENLVHGDLINLLQGWGITAFRVQPRLEYPAYQGFRAGEFDLVAINGEEVVVVEVKSTLEKADVHRFIEKLEIFKQIPTEYKGKKIYGAVAYLEVIKEASEYAQSQGLFVIKAPGGDSKVSTLTNARDFKPKKF